MATANETVKKVLTHLNKKIDSVGGVVESSITSDGSFYRVFSDGFIEQGGHLETTNRVVTLPMPFKSKPLTLVAVADNAEETNMGAGQVSGLTLTTFFIRTVNDGQLYTEPCYWYACGY